MQRECDLFKRCCAAEKTLMRSSNCIELHQFCLQANALADWRREMGSLDFLRRALEWQHQVLSRQIESNKPASFRAEARKLARANYQQLQALYRQFGNVVLHPRAFQPKRTRLDIGVAISPVALRKENGGN